MSRTGRIVIGMVVAVVVVGLLASAYVWFSGGSGQASQAITAPTLDVSNRNASPTEAGPTSAAPGEATAATTAQAAASGVVFNIVPEQSEVTFTMRETLRGERTEVVGKTNQVAGQILVNFDDPAQSQVGTIRINVKTLATNEEFRNRAIRTAILQSNQAAFEFSEFKPTSLEDLPQTVTIGQPLTFKINGDLTIRDITQPVTFDATVTPTSKTELTGTAKAQVTRTQYNLTIPSVAFVADVSDEVVLQIDFVAVAAP